MTTRRWLDLSALAAKASDEMGPEQLIHGPEFTLLQAMGATELMDPKTDGGFGMPPTLDDLVAASVSGSGNSSVNGNANIVPDMRTLSPMDVVRVMDRLWACEIQWLEGSTLAQTLFTCVYLLKPDAFGGRDGNCAGADTSSSASVLVLSAYMTAVLRCCNHVRENVMRADLYDEGEFTTELHGFDLAFDVSDADAVRAMENAEDLVNGADGTQSFGSRGRGKGKGKGKRSGKAKPKVTSDGDGEGESCPDCEPYAADPHVRAMLLARLAYRKSILQAHIAFNQPMCTGLSTARRCLASAADALASIKQLGHGPGIGLEIEIETIVPPSSAQATLHLPAAPGFFYLINRPMLTFTPPRNVPECTFSDGIRFSETLVTDLMKVPDVYDCTSVDDLIGFFNHFSDVEAGAEVEGGGTDHAHLLVRSRLFTTFHSGGLIFGRLSVSVFILGDLGVPRSLGKNADVQRALDGFVKAFASPFIGLMRTLARNTALQHRRLASRHIIEWSGTMVKADESCTAALDVALSELTHEHVRVGVAWVNVIQSYMMVRYLELCLALELVGDDEVGDVIGYMAVVLRKSVECRAILATSRDSMSRSASPRAIERAHRDALVRSPVFSLLQARLSVCDGIRLLHTVLVHEGKVKKEVGSGSGSGSGGESETKEEAAARLRFESRFMPFLYAEDPPTYQQIRDMSSLSVVSDAEGDEGDERDREREAVMQYYSKAFESLAKGKKQVSAAIGLRGKGVGVDKGNSKGQGQGQGQIEAESASSVFASRQIDRLVPVLAGNCIAASLLASAAAGKVDLSDRKTVVNREKHRLYPVITLVKV